MRKEKVATVEILEKNERKLLYLYRHEDWFYTLEDEQGNVIKTFEPEEALVKAEKYLEEVKDRLFPKACIIWYEAEYLRLNNLDKNIGFKLLRDWYEEFLAYLNHETMRALNEDFVKGFWQTFRTFYKNSENFRKLLGKERYVLEQLFSSILVYVHMVLTGEDDKAKKLLTNLYGKGFKDWLFSVAEKLVVHV